MKTNIKCICLAVIFALSGCNDIFEKDINKNAMVVNAPVNDYISSTYTVAFWWEELQGALTYRLQIVRPSYNNFQSIVLDTMFENNEYLAQITLFPGTYEWRMWAENGSSKTQYVYRFITIDTNKDISNQEFFVKYPEDMYTTNKTVVSFSWPEFPYTEEYEYLLTDANKNKIKSIKTKQLSCTDTLTEGVFFWSVRAINNTNNFLSQYSSPRQIIIDITNPDPPVLQFPPHDALVTNPIKLSWATDNDVAYDSLLVAQDSTFTNILYAALVSDSTTYALPEQPINSSLYWKVYSVDKANNPSGYSTWNKFTITQ